MNSNSMRAALVAGALVLLGGFTLTGCSKDKLKTQRLPNQPPTVELTNAPVSPDRSNPYFYAYPVNWSGNDPDGRIDHYEYAIDPTPTNTVWIKTTKNQETIFFRASQPDPVRGNTPATASDFHIFAIKAIDNDRAESVVKALTDQGVPAAQLTAKGYGLTQPIENARTAQANAKNRRTVFAVTAAGAAPVTTRAGGQ